MTAGVRGVDVGDHPVDQSSGSRDPAREPTPRPVLVGLVLLSGFIAVAIAVATSSGLGVTPDGVSYLSMADEFRTTGSPYPVLAPSPTHYPPLWSVIVGGIAAVLSVDDLLAVGRVLNIVLAAAIGPLVYLAVRRSASATAWWALLAAVVVGLSFGLFRLSARALTEPLFVVLLLATLLLIECARSTASRRLLMSAAALGAALLLSRFAGIVIVVPLAFVAWQSAPSLTRRITDVVLVGALTVTPTAIWALWAPSTSASTHLSAGRRAGFADLIDSIAEAGRALVVSPSGVVVTAASVVLGAVVLLAPWFAAFLVARSVVTDGEPATGPSRLDRFTAVDLMPWLLFLASYTALIGAQRWWIGREVIDRYWLPYVVVAVVVVARALADVGLMRSGRASTVAFVLGGALAVVNLGQVAAWSVARADGGIALNELRFQNTELFDVVESAEVSAVLTDSVRLVELHLVVLGGEDVAVRSIGCTWSGESRAAELARAAAVPTAVVLADFCDTSDNRDAVAAIAGSTVVDTDVGTVVLLP